MIAAATIHVAMWSGPRNISTAMMRAWENRGDTYISDEPFYAPYLRISGYDHPLRDKILAHHDDNWESVVNTITGRAPGGAKIWYQKQMAHHMVAPIDRAWITQMSNILLIRHPREVLLSYAKKMERATLQELGYLQLIEIYEQIVAETGEAPPIIDSTDFLNSPEFYLGWLCGHLGIEMLPEMLHWPAGRRKSDGIWASHWYDSVEKSTRFNSYMKRDGEIAADLLPVLEASLPLYQQLAEKRLLR